MGTPRGTSDRAKGAIPGIPAAVALPTSASYLVSTQLVGPTTVAAGSAFPQYESLFVQYSDAQWATYGADWSMMDYYDRAMNHYAYWVRMGDPKYWDRRPASRWTIARTIWSRITMAPRRTRRRWRGWRCTTGCEG